MNYLKRSKFKFKAKGWIIFAFTKQPLSVINFNMSDWAEHTRIYWELLFPHSLTINKTAPLTF